MSWQYVLEERRSKEYVCINDFFLQARVKFVSIRSDERERFWTFKSNQKCHWKRPCQRTVWTLLNVSLSLPIFPLTCPNRSAVVSWISTVYSATEWELLFRVKPNLIKTSTLLIIHATINAKLRYPSKWLTKTVTLREKRV